MSIVRVCLNIQNLLVAHFLLSLAELLLKGAIAKFSQLFELVEDVLVGPPIFVEE